MNAKDGRQHFVAAKRKKKSSKKIGNQSAMEDSNPASQFRLDDCTNLRLPTDLTQNCNDIKLASQEHTIITELQLARPPDTYENVEFVRLCTASVAHFCSFCYHVRRIAVNGKNLVLHLLAEHRFSTQFGSIQPEQITDKLKKLIPELENEYFNLITYCTIGDGAYVDKWSECIFECFLCRYATLSYKILYQHSCRAHPRQAIFCVMCRLNYFSFSEIICHLCPAAPQEAHLFNTTIKYRCFICEVTNISSPFRLMVHLRREHATCEVCLEYCVDQTTLYYHALAHPLFYKCYRCAMIFPNKQLMLEHLFFVHCTESFRCKRCLQKRWRFIYHFCMPPVLFECAHCNRSFTQALYFKVHLREHANDFKYPCTNENCMEKFVSKRLLKKHEKKHEEKHDEKHNVELEENKKYVANYTNIVITGEMSMNTTMKSMKKTPAVEKIDDLIFPLPNLSDSDSNSDRENETKPNNQQTTKPNVLYSQNNDTAEKTKTNEKPEDEEHINVKAYGPAPNQSRAISNWSNVLTASGSSSSFLSDSSCSGSDLDICASDSSSRSSKRFESQRNQGRSILPKKMPGIEPFEEGDYFTTESETDEEFYEEYPQKVANAIFENRAERSRKTSKVMPPPQIDPLKNLATTSACKNQTSSYFKADQPRSQRVRRPTKFSEFETEDDNKHTENQKSTVDKYLLKPEPPPELTWDEEDLPSPESSFYAKRCFVSNLMKRAMEISEKRKAKKLKKANKDKVKPLTCTTVRHDGTDVEINELKQQKERPEQNLKQLQPLPLSSKIKEELPWQKREQQLYATEKSPNITHVMQTPIPDPTKRPSANQMQIPNVYTNENTIPIKQPSGARLARVDDDVYCYCRGALAELSEMVYCSGYACNIGWFHKECVGVKIQPECWYCAKCRQFI